ncbi:cation acetate symporter [Desulfosporosinus sp. BG]|uniref:sodium/solute symporter n=1 Tax=Desulfosporosinus sp. BG TaxID=1633135 RepID=UPI00083A7AEB|nr:cation acetate symporter [Desulfosporosinus sp. BG]ODA42342.1 Acetate permease ActP (cation/acetate symporter) [Desulfosporosinus sp. BG]
MNYSASPGAIAILICFIISVLSISFHFARKTRSASDYYAAGRSIHWSINGIAFAGDYLSAASFLGICGMIATYGFDGFLYAIGFLAGWMVALFIVAEPMNQLGRYTFTDALDRKFNSKGIRLMGAVSTLLVSLVYLIPQMVGAGTLVTPLLGLPHEAGVVIVGFIVIAIVATAGMASTTYVQFFKGALLIIFSLILVFLVFSRGLSTSPDKADIANHNLKELKVTSISDTMVTIDDPSYKVLKIIKSKAKSYVKLSKDNVESLWTLNTPQNILEETEIITQLENGSTLYNGEPKANNKFFQVGTMSEIDGQKATKDTAITTGSLNPFSLATKISNGVVVRWDHETITDETNLITVYYQIPMSGKDILSPGLKFKVDPAKGATSADRFNFVSLMLALFLGTVSLPHILIRYYTVPSPSSARKSTLVAIAAIALFYILTLYMGLGAMTGGVLDLTNENMAAPLLSKSIGIAIFAMISAIAFSTVLGTVSGLIVAASGAIAHDLMDKFFNLKLTDKKKVFAGKITAIVVGCIAMVLGILFKNMNVAALVGWAFAVAACANFPSIIMILFWKKTTAAGVIGSIIVGLITSLGIILFSQDTYSNVYHLVGVVAPFAFSNPALVGVPLSFITLIVVSLFTQKSSDIKSVSRIVT